MAPPGPSPAPERQRVHLRVHGVVQGVGFRPFVHTLAAQLSLGGRVGNDTDGVFIEAEGAPAALDEFLERLAGEAPPLADIAEVAVRRVPPQGETAFAIAASATGGARTVLVSPDVATCVDCLSEVRDPHDRRYRYPFTNCTNCGPRYSIVEDVPYDRPNTTMAHFALCADCDREYHDPTDRRFHAQPVCCPACGPHLRLLAGGEEQATEDAALLAAAERLRGGAVVAVKGIGGYHLAVIADDSDATERLRARKHREHKPFAVMVRDLAQAAGLCDITPLGAELLTSRARPIVLLPRRAGGPVAPAVAPGNRSLGLLLAYTPLHDLLLEAVGAPLVMTSGNVSDEPIAYRDEDAIARLGDIADAFLVHDRPIAIRVDDSVVRPMAGRAVPLRRARGHAPGPLPLPVPARRHVLAVGAELKSTVCLARGRQAFVSQHIGDLENYETFRSFVEAIGHLGRLFDVTPQLVAHDLHPEYLSTKHALDLGDVELVGVQHHHAHVASCLADNGEAGTVIGVAFDGTGYGTDGTLWGGEVLVADLAEAERVAHLHTVPLPGGPAAIREPWRMAAVHTRAAFDEVPGELDVRRRNAGRWDQVLSVADAGVNAPPTSSAGRLFDAVAALVGLRDEISYEGQAAIELEQAADPAEKGAYPFGWDVDPDGMLRLRGADLVRAVVDELHAGASVDLVAARFHNGVAAGVAEVCRTVAEDRGLTTVALSGGVFQNLLLTERVVARLTAEGLRVLTHRQVPPNDGGISLGQAAVAAARDRAR